MRLSESLWGSELHSQGEYSIGNKCMKYTYHIKSCIKFTLSIGCMNDESFHTVYDCSRFRVIRWCRGEGGPKG